MDVGTIGSAPCEVTLNDILMKLNDPKITKISLGRRAKLQNDLQGLRPLIEASGLDFFKKMARLIHHYHIAQFDKVQDKIPKEVYTFTRCCFSVVYRKALRDAGDIKPRKGKRNG